MAINKRAQIVFPKDTHLRQGSIDILQNLGIIFLKSAFLLRPLFASLSATPLASW